MYFGNPLLTFVEEIEGQRVQGGEREHYWWWKDGLHGEGEGL